MRGLRDVAEEKIPFFRGGGDIWFYGETRTQTHQFKKRPSHPCKNWVEISVGRYERGYLSYKKGDFLLLGGLWAIGGGPMDPAFPHFILLLGHLKPGFFFHLLKKPQIYKEFKKRDGALKVWPGGD